MPDNIASETGGLRFKQNRQRIKAAACGGQPDTGFARAAAAPPRCSSHGRQLIPHGKDSRSPWEGLSCAVAALKPVVWAGTEMLFTHRQLFPASDGSRPKTSNATGEQS